MQYINSYIFSDNKLSITIDTTLGDGLSQFTIPGNPGLVYNATINWGDGSTSEITAYNDADLAHSYSVGGVYTIKISGTFQGFYFNNGGDKLKVTGVQSLGDVDYQMAGGDFYGCTNLTGTFPEIPDSVTTIGNNAFRDNSFTGSLVIPDSVTSIGDYVFDGNSFTGSLTIPDSVTSIGIASFQNNSFTGSLTIPDSVTSIGIASFRNNSFTGSLTIPDSVTSIGDNAFRSNSFTGSLIIGNSVTSIGVNAFRDNSFTGSLIIPDSVTSIEDYAFDSNSFDGTLTIGNSVTSIGIASFQNNSFTGSLTIPDSVTSIGIASFRNNSGITRVDSYPLTAPTTGTDTFAFGGSARPLHIQSSGTSGYGVNPWTDTSIFSSITADL